MEVTIGTQACTSITITDVAGLGEFTCSAPPGPGTGIVQLRVDIDSGSATTRFLYDAPSVTGLRGAPCDAAAPCPLVVRSPVTDVHTSTFRLLAALARAAVDSLL
jgi:hypothetical protein